MKLNNNHQKINIKKFLLLALLFLIGLVFITLLFQSPKKVEIKKEQEEITQNTSNLGGISPEELEKYKQSQQSPETQYLKETFNFYLAGNLDPAIQKELDMFDKEYYKSKMVVLTSSANIAGGLDIQIIFINKPDKIFNAWIYKLADGNYELRGFDARDDITPEQIKETISPHTNLFEEIAI